MRTQAHINLKSLAHNFNVAQQTAPHSQIIAITKSNAYGHGLIKVAKHLPCAYGFGVACAQEAIQLRNAGIKQPIILLSGFTKDEGLHFINEYQLDFVVHEKHQIETLQSTPLKYPTQIWLKIDTGMHRLGFAPNEFPFAFKALNQLFNVTVNLMTHLADADRPQAPKNEQQLSLFKQLTSSYRSKKSIANSAALAALPETHADFVRPGVMLYGISPLSEQTAQDLNLKPVMTLSSQLIAIRTLKKGETLGYGSTWQCPHDKVIGTIATGYGDGYPRHASHETVVNIQGKLCPLVGRVSMDMLTVDLSACHEAQVGDKVILWGEGLPIENIAASANCIPYELVCNVSRRVEFTYES